MKHGGDVWNAGKPSEWLDFSANLRPEGPFPWIRNVISDAMENVRYYPDPEMKRARKGMAAFLALPEECVLVTAGGIAAIDLALTSSEGCVYTMPPAFSEYHYRAAIHGRPYGAWDGKCRKGDTLVVCNPNNPTGSILTRTELLNLWSRLTADGGELLIDEAFIEYSPGYSMRSCIRPGMIIAGSMSKILGTPGIRLGYLCTVPETIQILRSRMMPWPLDAFAEEVAAQLPAHMDEIRAEAGLNAGRRSAFAERLQETGGKVYPSESNFLLVDFCRGMSPIAAELKSRGILVRTCSSFGLPDSVWRLAVKTEAENSRLVNVLEELLHAR